MSPWCPSYADERRHRHCLRRLSQWIRLSPTEQYDDRMCILFMAMLAFGSSSGSAEAAALRNGANVERVQLKYALLLSRYLKSVLGPLGGTAKFGAGVAGIALAREAYDMHSNMLPF